LRAIYNHSRKTNKKLSSDNPADAVDWNEEKRRGTGMGAGDLKGWFSELALLENPVRREFHLFMLLSGSRPTALQGIKRPDGSRERVARRRDSGFKLYHHAPESREADTIIAGVNRRAVSRPTRERPWRVFA
jgi:hypothetical protein